MAFNLRENVTPPREALVSWLARLYQHGLTTTTGGNLSIIDDDGTMYITPSGGDKAIVPPEKVAVRRKEDAESEFTGVPSMEWPLHTAAYKSRPDCKAVLHAHSMTLVAFSLAKAEGLHDCDPRLPDTRVLLGAYQACGKVAFSPYDLPGSQALADGCRKQFDLGADCVILQNHGVVVVGKDMRQAYDRFVSLEYLARSIVNAAPLSLPPKPISSSVLKYANELDSDNPENPFPKKIPMAPSKFRILDGSEKEARANLCKFVHRAYDQNLITSSSGSFSARLSDKCDVDLSFIITPTGVDRLNLEASDLCFVSSKPQSTGLGEERSEPKRKMQKLSNNNLWYYPMNNASVSPSRAAKVHASIFRAHPDINYIMVVQPPFATSYCITGKPFDSAGIPESHVILHNVQTLFIESVLENDGLELCQALDPKSGKTTVLVDGYGLVAIGQDLLKTFVQVEVCESMCGVSLTALRRGPMALLTKEQVADIDEAFNMHH